MKHHEGRGNAKGKRLLPAIQNTGIAINTLDLLVKDAKEQGVLQIALEATYIGRPLYER